MGISLDCAELYRLIDICHAVVTYTRGGNVIVRLEKKCWSHNLIKHKLRSRIMSFMHGQIHPM